MPDVDREISRQFWLVKARDSSNRWTPSKMLEFELDLATGVLGGGRTVLDLGSGHGELSRRIAQHPVQLVAVDWVVEFTRAFDAPNHSFVQSTVAEYETEDEFDLVLLFGVVTCLTRDEEVLVYRKAAEWVAPDGSLIVKNQCARHDEFVFTGVSEALGSEYSGRYPNAAEQRSRLVGHFRSVEMVAYPDQFNPWDNSFHVAFVCREPIPQS